MSDPLKDILDKGLAHTCHKWLHYLPIYHRHFDIYRKQKSVRILEIGIQNGGSLDLWNEYFGKDNCEIVGVDIDPKCASLAGGNITIHIGDQENKYFLMELLDLPPFDIIIDDGGHTMAQQINTFEMLFGHVKPGGIYLCEDLHTSYWPQFGGGDHPGTFINYSKRFIDMINGYHHKFTQINNITKTCSGIHYYDSMIFMDKAPKLIESPQHKHWYPKT